MRFIRIKLNLGCGNNYKPGYINIDKYNSTIADKICDTSDLSFDSNVVDLIEALQLIEHFDYIHCKYALSEWFRVLKPNGILIIETPDLALTYEKLINEDIASQKKTLQWIFGIESRGMVHKTGFTFSLMNNLLEEIGFEDILREKQQTHVYEHGMRIICKKPEIFFEKQLFACFRKRLRSLIQIDDSFLLIPLESWIQKVLETFSKYKKDKLECFNMIIACVSTCNPLIPLAFIEECLSKSIISESDITSQISILKKLQEIKFNKKALTLWKKRGKEISEIEMEFDRFVDYIEKLIHEILKNPEDFDERFEYMMNLENTEVLLFDMCLILEMADRMFNLGVKSFHNKKYSDALSYFIKSNQLNPDHYESYWNIARLECILDYIDHKIIDNYEKALKLAYNDNILKEIKMELKLLKDEKKTQIRIKPILRSNK